MLTSLIAAIGLLAYSISLGMSIYSLKSKLEKGSEFTVRIRAGDCPPNSWINDIELWKSTEEKQPLATQTNYRRVYPGKS